MLKKILVVVLIIFLLTGCSYSSENEKIYNNHIEVADQRSEEYSLIVSSIIADNTKQASEISIPAKQLSGDLSLSIVVFGDIIDIHPLYIFAQEFMKMHTDVKIDITTIPYDLQLNYITKISTAIMSNKSADIIDLYGMPYVKYADSGLICDLYPYMDNDEDFNKEDYYNNVFKANERNGSLCILPLSFMYSPVSMLLDFNEKMDIPFDSYKSISYKEMLDIYIRALDEKIDDSVIYMSKKSSAMSYFEFTWNDLIDYKNKTAYFDTEEFINDLKKMKRIALAENVEMNPEGFSFASWGAERIDSTLFSKNSTYLFYTDNLINLTVQNLLPYEKSIYTKPIPKTFTDGNLSFSSSRMLAIAKTCENKELAWEFIKYCIKERDIDLDYMTYSGSILYDSCIPINKNNFKAIYKALTEKLYENSIKLGYNIIGDKDTIINDTVSQIHEWNMFANMSQSFDITLFYSLIYPDLYAYLTDQQTAEKTAKAIQSKVEIYINE